MQATTRMASVESSTLYARRRLIWDVFPSKYIIRDAPKEDAMIATPPAPRPMIRVMIIMLVWFAIFGAVTTVSPLNMEGGYDPIREKIGATLTSPVLGLLGFAAFFGGGRPSGLMMLISFAAIVGLPAAILFRCWGRPAFWTFMGLHVIVVTIASIGFQQLTKYWSEHP